MTPALRYFPGVRHRKNIVFPNVFEGLTLNPGVRPHATLTPRNPGVRLAPNDARGLCGPALGKNAPNPREPGFRVAPSLLSQKRQRERERERQRERARQRER